RARRRILSIQVRSIIHCASERRRVGVTRSAGVCVLLQDSLHAVAAETGIHQLRASLDERLGARWIVSVGIAEIERAPLASFERRTAILVTELEIRFTSDQEPDGID